MEDVARKISCEIPKQRSCDCKESMNAGDFLTVGFKF